MERLHNELLEECTELKAKYEALGGDASLGAWRAGGGRGGQGGGRRGRAGGSRWPLGGGWVHH